MYSLNFHFAVHFLFFFSSDFNCFRCILFFKGANAQQKEQIEIVAAAVAVDNLEIACAFIQKSSVEKCLMEIDKRLLSVCYCLSYALYKHITF